MTTPVPAGPDPRPAPPTLTLPARRVPLLWAGAMAVLVGGAGLEAVSPAALHEVVGGLWAAALGVLVVAANRWRSTVDDDGISLAGVVTHRQLPWSTIRLVTVRRVEPPRRSARLRQLPQALPTQDRYALIAVRTDGSEVQLTPADSWESIERRNYPQLAVAMQARADAARALTSDRRPAPPALPPNPWSPPPLPPAAP